MSDLHTGLPHDLPNYVPNWPVPVKVKAKVVKDRTGWVWAHDCPHRRGYAMAHGYRTQVMAFAAALKHARGCW